MSAYLILRPNSVHAPSKKSAASTAKTSSKPVQPTLRFAAMGDMLAHDTVNKQAASNGSYDYTAFFTSIKPLYRDADVVFCNPETIATGSQLGVSGYPTFNAPTEFARDLVGGAGCNLINMASNHMNDKGQTGIDANLTVWDNLPVLAKSGSNRSAAEQQTVRYFTKNNIKVAFLAFADYSNNTSVTSYGLNIYHQTGLVDALMTEARNNADAVIVSMHWGTEDSTAVNTDQQAAAEHLAAIGADVIIGTGPHVLQETTWLTAADGHKTLVWYSIGNMLSAQLKLAELTGGVAGFTITKTPTTSTVTDPTFSPTFMSYDWSAADKAADNLLARNNLRLEPLGQATGRPEAMFGSQYSVAERTTYVHQTLTDKASLTFQP